MIKKLFEIPYFLIKRPWIYWISLQKNEKINLQLILTYIAWYWVWVHDSEWIQESDDLKNKWFEFQMFVRIQTVWSEYIKKNWISMYQAIMMTVNNNQEEALDLFFKLLDEFIKKEWIKLDMN